jgi:hypothetical protein
VEYIMKSTLAMNSFVTVPDPHSRQSKRSNQDSLINEARSMVLRRTKSVQGAKWLHWLRAGIANWFAPRNLPQEEVPATAQEIDELERHIQKILDNPRSTSFPC